MGDANDRDIKDGMNTSAAIDEKFAKQTEADLTKTEKVALQQTEVDNPDRGLVEPTDPDREQEGTTNPDREQEGTNDPDIQQKGTTNPDREQEGTTNPGDTDKELVKQRLEEQHLIQIVASNEEINRRIAALIEQKQRELDENNCQEFCGVHPGFQDLENHCARTAAVFVPRAGGKSHIKVSRVVNMYGPQTRALGQTMNERHCQQNEHKPDTNMMEGIEERLANMEEHLKLPGSSKSDVYSRLKNLEERILFLESLSPEYFTSGAPPVKRARKVSPLTSKNDINQDLSLSEIDMRIQALKDSLHQRYLQR